MTPERTLSVAVGLAILLAGAVLVSKGSGGAGQDAARTLSRGGDVRALREPLSLQVAGPLRGVGTIKEPGQLPHAGQVSAVAADGPPDSLPGTRPLYVDDPVEPFGCFGGCGASCSCAGKRESQKTVAHGGQSCTYQVIQCNTHPFCVWHDQCYLDCDKTMPNAVRRSGCYRQCDSSCVSGYSPWSNYPHPPDSYSISDCVRWARHRDSAPATGTLTFSKLQGCAPGA